MKKINREDLRIAFIMTAGVGAIALGACGNLSHNHSTSGALAAAKIDREEQSLEDKKASERESEIAMETTCIETTYIETTIAETTTVAEIVTTAQSPTEPPQTAIVTTAEEISTEATTEPYIATIEPVIRLTEYEKVLLLKLGSIEAGGQGVKGIALVLRVVINRCVNTGASIEQVIYSPRQFAATTTHLWAQDYVVPDAYEALNLIEYGWDESCGATYFCTTQANAWHSNALTYLFKWGDHEFYR